MSSTRVGHEQDRLLKKFSRSRKLPSRSFVVLCLIFVIGLHGTSGIHVVRNNNRSSIASSHLEDLEPKTGLQNELRNATKAQNKLANKKPEGSEFADAGQSQGIPGITFSHSNGSAKHTGIPGTHHLGEKNETGQEKDDLGVEDILRKIFGAEFEDEDEAEDDELHTRDDLEEDFDEDTRIIQASKSETADIPWEKYRGESTPHQLKTLSRHIRDDGVANSGQKRNSLKTKGKSPKRKPGADPSANPPKQTAEVKAQNLAKYNEYMDAVLERMNILIKKKRMDPLRVNLYSGPSKSSGNKGGNKQAKHPSREANKKTKKKNNARMDLSDEDTIVQEPEHDDSSDDEINAEDRPAVRNVHIDRDSIDRQIRSLLSNVTFLKGDAEEFDPKKSVVDSVDTFEEARSASPSTGGSKQPIHMDGIGQPRLKQARGNRTSTPKGKKKPQNAKGQETRNPTKQKPKVKGGVGGKNKNRNPNAPRPTRGILHGLSTLRRDGNVQVVKDGAKARIVRAKFLLGPVSLEIQPKKGKRNGHSEEVISDPALSASTPPPAALTATAPKLKGVLEVRLSPKSPTRIRRLRVFPPGKVVVDGDKSNNGGGVVGPGYRKISPHATARLRQAAIQVVRQVDHKMKLH